MFEELKKPIHDVISTGKEAIGKSVRDNDESKAFFEKLSEKLAKFGGQTVVPNEELKYNKEYDPKKEEQ